jgi:hypothetical protein
MVEQPVFSEALLAERSLLRGVIIRADSEHQFVVRVRQGEDEWIVAADRVVNSETPVRLGRGDRVLCWVDGDDREHGVVLGRIGPSVVPAPAAAAPAALPDTLVLEAKQALTLRVGDGSITIREDGKILIKGKDLVSHAQRTNRIKGGAVAIN